MDSLSPIVGDGVVDTGGELGCSVLDAVASLWKGPIDETLESGSKLIVCSSQLTMLGSAKTHGAHAFAHEWEDVERGEAVTVGQDAVAIS